MNVARASIKLFIANTLNALIVFLGISIFARRLDPAILGTYFLFQSMVEILSIPVDFGVRGAAEKRISEKQAPGKVFTTSILLKLLTLTITIVGIMIARDAINAYLGARLAVYLIVAIVLREYALLIVSVLNGEMRVGETAVLHLSRHIVWFVVSGLSILAGYGVRGLVYGLLAGFGTMLLWGMVSCSTPFRRPSLGHVRSLFDYSKYNLVSTVGGYIYNWIDVLVIGFFLTQAHVGAYEIAWRVTVFVVLFSNAIATAIFPKVSEWDARDEVDQLETLLPRAISPSLLFVIPAFFGTALFSRDILRLVFGPQYTVAWLVLIILMADKLTTSILTIINRSLLGIDRPDLAARATVASLVLNIGLNVVLVHWFGIAGAAAATTVASTVGGLLHVVYLSRFVTIRVSWFEIGWFMAAASGMMVVLAGIRSFISIRTLFDLLFVLSMGGTFYIVVILLIPSMRSRLWMIYDDLNSYG